MTLRRTADFSPASSSAGGGNTLRGLSGGKQKFRQPTEYSVTYKINPATALKGINLLVDEGLLYKKKGFGYVCGKRRKRGEAEISTQELFYCDYVEKLVREAKNLGLTASELTNLIERGFKDVD